MKPTLSTNAPANRKGTWSLFSLDFEHQFQTALGNLGRFII
jgi:hypothetical protein